MTFAVSRRALLLLAGALGCRSEAPQRKAEHAVEAKPEPVTDLQFVTVTNMAESERGGTAVVVLHGWGAAGDDLVSLARRLQRPRSRFFVPAGPLAQGNGRAWWYFDKANAPAHSWDGSKPDGYRDHAQMLSARHAAQKLLRDVRSRYQPERVAVIGFSQGAMLSLDLALVADPPVDRVGVLSGALIAESVDALRAPHEKRPTFFVSHGRSDNVLPFGAGAGIDKTLQKYGYSVQFHAFDGGHQIPAEVVAALGEFLFGP